MAFRTSLQTDGYEYIANVLSDVQPQSQQETDESQIEIADPHEE
jgi:hypothetical protein